jgi:hypothetical protein
MMSTHDAISGFTLERYALGELEGDELRAAEAVIAADPALALRVDQIRAERDAFLRAEPYAKFRVAHEARRAPKQRWLAWMGLTLVTAAAVVVLMVQPTGYEGVKGNGVGLSVTLVGAGAPKALASGARVHAGDRLQLAYDAGEAQYVALLGIDGAGAVSVYYPDASDVMVNRPGAARASFPFSLTLDATPGSETMVAVFADKPLRTADLAEALRAGRTLTGARTARVVLEKEP